MADTCRKCHGWLHGDSRTRGIHTHCRLDRDVPQHVRAHTRSAAAAPLTPEEELTWARLTRRKLKHTDGDTVHVPAASHGKGHHLIEIPVAQTGSDDASPRSLRARSQWLDTAIAVVSAPAHSTPADKERHMRAQMLHWQERHAAWFDRNA